MKKIAPGMSRSSRPLRAGARGKFKYTDSWLQEYPARDMAGANPCYPLITPLYISPFFYPTYTSSLLLVYCLISLPNSNGIPISQNAAETHGDIIIE